MKKSETAKIVTLITMYEDLTEPSEEKVEAWHLVLGDLTFLECEVAAVAFYKRESRRIWPADVYQHVISEREQWYMRNPPSMDRRATPPWMEQGGSAALES